MSACYVMWCVVQGNYRKEKTKIQDNEHNPVWNEKVWSLGFSNIMLLVMAMCHVDCVHSSSCLWTTPRRIVFMLGFMTMIGGPLMIRLARSISPSLRFLEPMGR